MAAVRWGARRFDEPTRRRLRRLRHRAWWGNLRRQRPLSDKFGYDRGEPIDRAYMRRYLEAQRGCVRGVVGEVAERRYADLLGGPKVQEVAVIDNDPSNPAATLVADLSSPDALAPASFDCLIVTQVLQYLPRPWLGLQGLVAALRPGGTLLVAAPALTPHDLHEADEGDYWRFWPAGLETVLRDADPSSAVDVRSYGSLVTAVAFLYGLSVEDLRPEELLRQDLRFPVVVCGRLDRPVNDEALG